jgi:hypothetical protein
MTRIVVLGLLTAFATDPGGGADTDTTAAPRWIVSVDLAGPPATDELSALPAGVEIPGTPVADLPGRPQALARVDAELFATRLPLDAPTLQPDEAPAPGQSRWVQHGATTRAVHVVATETETDPWGAGWDEDRPAHWGLAALAVDAAPLFAAPAFRVPAAGLRHGFVERGDDVFLLGHVDRCRDDRRRDCLRWAQVVARHGPRFVGGYLPAFLVTPREDWAPSPTDRPRAQLVRTAIRDGVPQWLLWFRTDDGQLHRTTVRATTASEDGWPPATLAVVGELAQLSIDGLPLSLTLDDRLDARPEDL